MDTVSGESHDRLRQAIDAEINSLEQSIRVLKARRNALAPISRLPPESLAAIFSFLPPSANDLKWICVSHVCRQWREAALNHPRLWSHINLTKPAPTAIAEIFARAKTVPLYLDVDFPEWRSLEKVDAFERQVDAHISHTRHLRLCGLLPPLERLVSSAPTLEFLSLLHKYGPSDQIILPANLFNCTTPSLTSLELVGCDISWKSPLLKGLQALEIRWPSAEARPKLEDWLDALNEMSQLKTLSLHSATPVAPPAPLTSEPSRTVTLPSLTKFDISASAKNCTLAFAHLVMPALTWLHIVAKSHKKEGEDMQPIIPYIARNVLGLQETEPLRNILISSHGTRLKVFAWIMPDADLDGYNSWRYDASVPARLTFTAEGMNWRRGVDMRTFDALSAILPVDSVLTFVAHDYTRLSKEFWLSQAPRWSSLEQVHLGPTAVKGFRDMLAEDVPPDGPRLPLLKKLILIHVALTTPRTLSLRDMLIERVEQGVPLEVLDLRTCVAPEHIVQLFREIVVDVTEPPARDPTEEVNEFAIWDPQLFNLHAEIGSLNEVEFEDDQGPTRDERYLSEDDEDEDDDEDGAEYDDEYYDSDNDYNSDDGY